MMKMNRLIACFAAFCSASVLAQSQDMFPFVIPGLMASPAGSIVDVSLLNDAPAGGHGFVRVRDGHFVDGRGKRLRFLATNFTFGSCFPDHDTADKLAGRLASLGINCIRFHHTDNQSAPQGIWKAGTAKKNEFDPGQLDRLDYFIAALKRHGTSSLSLIPEVDFHLRPVYLERTPPDPVAGEESGVMRDLNVISAQNAEHYAWGVGCDGWHLLRSSEFSVIQERMPPGTSEVSHFHNLSHQFFYVLSGMLSIRLDGKLHVLSAEQGLEAPPKVKHQVFNESAAEVRFMVISVPPSHGDRILSQ